MNTSFFTVHSQIGTNCFSQRLELEIVSVQILSVVKVLLLFIEN